jgi:hypothetical protein
LFIESFILFNLHYQTLNRVLTLKQKAQSLVLLGLFDPSELAVGSLYKVLGIESFTQSLCLKAIPGIYSYNFFGWGDDPGG